MLTVSANSGTDPDRLVIPDEAPVRLGMPELCRAGLSENWLWKACGDRHWRALATAHGLNQPDFRSEDGSRLYPAFISVTLKNGELGAAHENDMLNLPLTLERIGRTRFRSQIAVFLNGGVIAELSMESVFLRRMRQGVNRSVARNPVAGPCSLVPTKDATPPFRPNSWTRHGMFDREHRRELKEHVILPNPHEEFNGAEFLYFSSFQAMIDRAEWAWFQIMDPLLTTSDRTIHYSSNIELGDAVRVVLCDSHRKQNGLSHWVELRRLSDDGLIASAFSDKAYWPSGRGGKAAASDIRTVFAT